MRLPDKLLIIFARVVSRLTVTFPFDSVGLVSSAGAIPITFARDVIGPMTKNAYDSALLLQIIAGPNQRDPNSKYKDDLELTSASVALIQPYFPTSSTFSAKRSPYAKDQIDYLKSTENPTFKGKTLGFHPWKPLSDSTG